eukprot:Opistho-2@80349
MARQDPCTARLSDCAESRRSLRLRLRTGRRRGADLAKALHVLRRTAARRGMGRFDIGGLDRVETPALPFRDDGARHRVADDVGRRAAHVEEMIDAEDEEQARLGNVEEAERRGDHDEAGARHAGDALAGDHQHQQHRDFLTQGQVDAISLRDEDRREGHVDHRAVEVEAVAQRQHEAGDARRHAEAIEGFEGTRIGGFGRCGREGEEQGIADVADQQRSALTDDQIADADQQRPQDQHAEVEGAHEVSEVADDRRTTLRQRRRHRCEHRDRCEAHDVIGHLKHHMHQRLDRADQRLGLFADCGDGNADEQREDDDLKDLVLRHRLDPRFRENVGEEILEVEGNLVDAAGRVNRRQREVEADTGLEEVDEDQAQRERDEAGADEPQDRTTTDATERCGIAHMCDARDEGGEDQRRDDHLDQVEEDRGDDREIVGDLLELRLGAGRIGTVALVDTVMEPQAHNRA